MVKSKNLCLHGRVGGLIRHVDGAQIVSFSVVVCCRMYLPWRVGGEVVVELEGWRLGLRSVQQERRGALEVGLSESGVVVAVEALDVHPRQLVDVLSRAEQHRGLA